MCAWSVAIFMYSALRRYSSASIIDMNLGIEIRSWQLELSNELERTIWHNNAVIECLNESTQNAEK